MQDPPLAFLQQNVKQQVERYLDLADAWAMKALATAQLSVALSALQITSLCQLLRAQSSLNVVKDNIFRELQEFQRRHDVQSLFYDIILCGTHEDSENLKIAKVLAEFHQFLRVKLGLFEEAAGLLEIDLREGKNLPEKILLPPDSVTSDITLANGSCWYQVDPMTAQAQVFSTTRRVLNGAAAGTLSLVALPLNVCTGVICGGLGVLTALSPFGDSFDRLKMFRYSLGAPVLLGVWGTGIVAQSMWTSGGKWVSLLDTH